MTPWLLTGGALGLLAVLLQFLPLTRELHYEFSAATAVLASVAAGLASLVAWWRRDDRPVVGTTGAIGWALAVTAVPLLVALVHNLVVGFCGLSEGMLWYLLLVPASAFVSVVVARLARTLVRRRWLQVVVFLGLWGVSMLRGAYEAVTGPHIFLYGWQVGFFPGGSWDPELPITPLLLLYRIAHVLLASLLLLVLFELEEVRAGRPRRGAGLALPASLAAAIVVALVPNRSALGLTRTDRWLREELGDELRTRFTTIYYHAPSTDSLDLWRAANYSDFFIAQQAAELGLDGASIEPVTFYAFASGSEQKRLVGTSSASFTKPWRRTLSLSFDRVESTLEHELAHIVLEPFGNFLGVSWSNGILEGAAVALEERDHTRELYRHARAAHDVGLAPPVDRIMSSTGFASYRASLSYMLAGSFCRWLLDTYGAARFRAAYASGDLEEHYGVPEDTLAARHRRFLDTLPLTDAALDPTVRHLYGGGSFFLQRCLRRLATLSGEGNRALAEERYDEALEHFRASIEEGISSGARAGILRALHGAGRYRELVDSIAAYERDTAAYWLLPYRVELADAFGMLGGDNAARREAALTSVVRFGSDEWTRVRALLRLILAPDSTAATASDSTMRRYFATPMTPLARIAMLGDVRRRLDRARPSWRLTDELLRLMQASLLVRQSPLLALTLASSDDAPLSRPERAERVGEPQLPTQFDLELYDRPQTLRQLFDGVAGVTEYAFARGALLRTLLDARLLASTRTGTLDAVAARQWIEIAYAVPAPRDSESELIGLARSRDEALRFVEYLQRHGAITP